MHLLSVMLLLVLSGLAPAHAAATRYALSTEASTVGFETDFGINKITGKMPISRADLTIDFARLANSQVDVTLEVSGASANFPFATEAMRGPKVLDARKHPQLIFHSTSVKAAGNGAQVSGTVTLRGITRPMLLNAEIWRRTGSETGDLSNLTVRLTGKLNRSAFGAIGWADMVGDEVRIVIIARITAKE